MAGEIVEVVVSEPVTEVIDVTVMNTTELVNATTVDAAGALMKEENVDIATIAGTWLFDASVYGRAVYTLGGNATVLVSNPAPAGKATTFAIRIKGEHTLTLPVDWTFAGTPPAYVGTGEGTTYVGTTEDGGMSYQVTVLAGWA